MIAFQPTNLRQYLGKKTLVVPEGTAHFFYASWEDALWDLLQFWKIGKKGKPATALVPEFFCGDVVQNMTQHSLECLWYPCDKNFATDPHVFRRWLTKHQPQVVVIFHAVGITNPLLAQKDIWLSALPHDAILIEDSVHRVVDPAELHFLCERHVVMDSLRKVVPLPGSNVYGQRAALAQLKPTPWWKTPRYQVGVYGWWCFFQILLSLRLYRLAERAMLAGYDVIGDSGRAGAGWFPARACALKLNIPKIEKCKHEQGALYRKGLSPLWEDPHFFLPKFPHSDTKKLRGFPVGLERDIAEPFLQKLRQKGLLVRFELNDSPWSQKQKIIYLPMGPHLRHEEINQVAHVVRQTMQELVASTFAAKANGSDKA